MKTKNETQDLILKGLYEESFILLDTTVQAQSGKLEQKKVIREFFTIAAEQFDTILDQEKMPFFAQSMVEAISGSALLLEHTKKLDSILDNEYISVMFSCLILSNQLESAKFFLPFFNRNMENFPNTLQELAVQKNSSGLLFMCQNMENIHYNNGETLRIAQDLPAATIVTLIDDYGFDPNENDKQNGLNLIHELISNKNIRNFKILTEKYFDKINWAQSFNLNNNQIANSFNLIDESGMATDFYSIMLAKPSLKANYVERIAISLFDNNEIIKVASQTDIYSQLFSHPNFDPNIFNLEQGHLIYGLISRIGIMSSDTSHEYMAKPYVKILDSFLNNYKDSQIPPAITYHIVGAAIFTANETKSQAAIDACSLILHRYKQYLNQPNPDGRLPIAQVEKDSPLYRMLINNGAVPPEPEPTFWSGMASMLGMKKKQAQVALKQVQADKEENKPGSLISVRAQMREDFRSMRETISSDLCDPTIKMRSENMFLTSDNLVQKMDKNNIQHAYEDVFFLSQNFSKYLKKSLEYYMQICQATVDFASHDQQESKLNNAKAKCVEQLDLLDQQIRLISNNIFSSAETNALMNMKVNSKFLEEKFEKSKVVDLEDITASLPSPSEKQDDVVQVIPSKKLKI